MHHVTLHKSSEDVDVTYKADVKFNAMGPRMKSGRIAARPSTTHSAPQLRHGLDTYLSHDVLISINLSHGAEGGRTCAGKVQSLVFTGALERRKARRALLFIRDEKSPGLDFRCKIRGRKSDLREIARLTASLEKGSGSVWVTVLHLYSPIYIPVSRILRQGVCMQNSIVELS